MDLAGGACYTGWHQSRGSPRAGGAKMKKSDILLAAGVLLAALALYLLFRPGGEGA